jgi:hypothetical protein
VFARRDTIAANARAWQALGESRTSTIAGAAIRRAQIRTRIWALPLRPELCAATSSEAAYERDWVSDGRSRSGSNAHAAVPLALYRAGIWLRILRCMRSPVPPPRARRFVRRQIRRIWSRSAPRRMYHGPSLCPTTDVIIERQQPPPELALVLGVVADPVQRHDRRLTRESNVCSSIRSWTHPDPPTVPGGRPSPTAWLHVWLHRDSIRPSRLVVARTCHVSRRPGQEPSCGCARRNSNPQPSDP